jgi:flagellar protein FliO/FliZ
MSAFFEVGLLRLAAAFTSGMLEPGNSSPVANALGGSGPDSGVYIWRVAGALVLCLLLGTGAILALRWREGRFGKFFPKIRRLLVIETTALGAQCAISLVQLDDQELLIGISPGGISVLKVGREAVVELATGDAGELL